MINRSFFIRNNHSNYNQKQVVTEKDPVSLFSTIDHEYKRIKVCLQSGRVKMIQHDGSIVRVKEAYTQKKTKSRRMWHFERTYQMPEDFIVEKLIPLLPIKSQLKEIRCPFVIYYTTYKHVHIMFITDCTTSCNYLLILPPNTTLLGVITVVVWLTQPRIFKR